MNTLDCVFLSSGSRKGQMGRVKKAENRPKSNFKVIQPPTLLLFDYHNDKNKNKTITSNVFFI